MTSQRTIFFFCGLLLILTFLPGRAALIWTTKEISLHPKLEDPDAVAHYKFKNTGKEAVTISSVTTSCPCTTAQADKSVYQPGETGEIIATLSVPVITGLEDKQIFVETADKKPRTVLDLKVYIPEIAKLTPPKLTWNLNEGIVPKKVIVDMISEHEINITGSFWGMRDRHFTATIETLEPHKKYAIVITPLGSLAPAQEALGLATDYPTYQTKCLYIPVSIESSESPAK